MNTVLRTINKRKSIRKFKADQIKPEELKAILDAAMQAPSARNRQTWHFTVIQNSTVIDCIRKRAKQIMAASEKEDLAKRGNDPAFDPMYGAPTVIVVSGQEGAVYVTTDCSAAIATMQLAAESLKIGSCWIGMLSMLFQEEDILKKLQIPEGYKPMYAVYLGYPDPKVKVIKPERNPDVVTFIK